MKLTRDSIKKSLTTTKKTISSNKSVENLKLSDYSTIQEEENSNLYQIALEEFRDLFEEIIILSKSDFFSSLEKYIQISLVPSEKIFPSGAINKVLYLIEKNYYNHEKEKIEKNLKLFNLSSSHIKYNNNNFIPHCKFTKEAIHSCGEKLYILFPNYYYCQKCNLIYKSDYILLKCDKCDIDYYTEIEREKEKEEKDLKNLNLKPATWSKYHCNAIINDTMRCSTCQNCLYLNTENNLLYCIKCNIQMNQSDIKWKCILCNKSFHSEAKIYNKYEYKLMTLAIKKTLFKAIEAKPKYLPCCNIYGDDVKLYKYFHKKECNGLLYEGELNKKKIVVCSKCHMLNFYENQYWLCPICKVRFHIQIKNNISLFDSISNKLKNQQIYQDRETINKREIYQKKRKNNLSIELKQNFEKKESEKEIGKSFIIESKRKKIFSTRNKFKKNNVFNNNLVNINDLSHIIFSNYKIKDNNRKEMDLRFKTIQDNKENCNEKETKVNMTNYKNNENNSEFLNGLSRNLTKLNNSKNIYPPQFLKSEICTNPNNSEIKSYYFNIIKNRQPTIYKHNRAQFSFDQVVIPTCENKLNNINSKKVLGFDRVLSQKEIKKNINPDLKILNDKNDLSTRELELFNNKMPFSKNKRKKKSCDDKPSIINKTNANLKNNIFFNLNKDSNIQDLEKKKEKEVKKIIQKKKFLLDKDKNIKEQILKRPILIKESFNSDDYNIIKQIGRGSFGKIYEVEDKFHRRFALKKIIACSIKEVEIIKSEYNILFGLSNLNINLIGIYGLETKKLDRTTFSINILMELAICDWEKEIIKRHSNKNYYTENELVLILKKLVNTFSILQKANVSHRDIKPQNILVCKGGVLKIADFGEAKKTINKNNDNNTIKQTIRGTELYMSPILFNSLRKNMIYKYTKHNTYKSDVFSLGYCMLLASTLSYNLLCEIREVKNMTSIKKIVQKYSNKNICIYSENYWNILFSMLELDEKNRPDFIDLSKIIETL